jgi:hypothetical protein
MLFFFTSSFTVAAINGKFTVLDADSLKFSVLLQINTNTSTAELGGATIVFGFNTEAISFTNTPIKDVDYVFHNFCGGNYSPATITRPMNNRIWINIDLPFSNSNNGTTVAVSPEWTDVVTIHFDLVDPNGSVDLSWQTTSPFWGIYDADNSTLWETGEFEDYPTSIETFSDLPKSYELAQNYPNPFNPSTKIRYTIPSGTARSVAGSVPVTLIVYDILGNEVSTLLNEEKTAGIYEVEFSAANLASGIYIYRLYSSEFTDTKKMVVIK